MRSLVLMSLRNKTAHSKQYKERKQQLTDCHRRQARVKRRKTRLVMTNWRGQVTERIHQPRQHRQQYFTICEIFRKELEAEKYKCCSRDEIDDFHGFHSFPRAELLLLALLLLLGSCHRSPSWSALAPLWRTCPVSRASCRYSVSWRPRQTVQG